MAGNVRFSISVATENGDVLPELEGRLKDLSPAFQAIIPEWAKLNKQIFDKSKGMEMSGTAVDENVFWDELKESTSKAKRRAGQEDQIMVATGALMRSLTDPDRIFQNVEADSAVFGTPLDPEDAAKVSFQWARRQVIFLSTIDQNVIRRIVKDYLSMGEGFQEKRFTAGLAAVRNRAEAAEMDAAFDNAVNDDTGNF